METKPKFKLEKGQSLTELAIMLVFVLTLLAGVVDLGRMMFEYLAMRDAAQEGAGYGSLYPAECSLILARVQDNLPDGSYTVGVKVNGLDCAAAFAVDDPKDLPVHGCEGKEIVISLDHTFNISMPFLTAFTGPTAPMHVEIKDRIVRPACE